MVRGRDFKKRQFFDAWFIDYTPDFITGLWVGFDEERSLGGE